MPAVAKRVAARSLHDASIVDARPKKDSKDSAEVAEVHGPARRAPVDRPYLESDVRYFLKQPSTPWIVFDKDVVETPPAAGGEGPPAEPSGLAVAADLGVGDAPDLAEDIEVEWQAPVPVSARLARVGAALAVTVAVVAGVVGVRAWASSPAQATVAAAAPPAPPPPAEPAPPEPPKALAAPTPKPPSAKEAAKVEATGAKKKLGRVVLRGPAASGFVYYDGKRLLGSGPRVFDVLCGTHSIAVGTREASREVDIPCGSAIVIAE